MPVPPCESKRVTRATRKADLTRSKIVATALDLFRTRGFDQTTMRDIAKASDVALGSAYYYFDSKEALVMAFYDQAKEDTHELIEHALEGKRKLESRLRAIITTKLEYFAPNRKFLGALFPHSANAQHPLSPFSDETRDIRESDMAHFAHALEGSEVRVPEDLKAHLPLLLWLYQMGVVLYWIQDHSPDQARTAVLLDKSLPLVAGLIRISSIPLLKPVRKRVVDLLEAVTAA
jgi:AcrR family transcriptional regulator